MKLRVLLVVVAVLMIAGPSFVSGRTVPTEGVTDRVWVFDQTNAAIKPCFLFSKAQGWVDFGGIGANGQFAWDDFRSIVQSELGLPVKPLEATVRFTAVPAGPGAHCPGPTDRVEHKTIFEVDGHSNVYIFFGGDADTHSIGDRDRDGDHDRDDR